MHNDNNSFYSIGRFIYYFTLGIIDSLVRGLFTTENNNMNDSSKTIKLPKVSAHKISPHFLHTVEIFCV